MDTPSQDTLKKTPLYKTHISLNAKMVPFGGWAMPVQYPAGLIAEHKCVRSGIGLFDVSHMGELSVMGRGAPEFIQKMATNDISKLEIGQAQYSALCNENGGVIDDIIIYKRGFDSFLICVNASNTEKDFNWLSQFVPKQGVILENLSHEYAQIAVQGPKSKQLLSSVVDIKLDDLKYYHFAEGKVLGIPTIIARTGYTGELGYELYCPAECAEKIWHGLFEMGALYGTLPCGLGARDTLRLEMGYLLYGNDMDETYTALECGLSWITKFDKNDFFGKQALMEQKKQGIRKKIVGFEMDDKAIGRHGYKIFDASQNEIGIVTSGCPSPSLQKNIGYAYVNVDNANLNNNIFIDVRGQMKPAHVVNKNFYQNGTAHI